MTKRIGFIGAGLMGHGAAKNILAGGFPLTVLGHRNRRPVEDLIGRGAREAKTAAELAADVDILFTCVPDSEVMENVVLGENGVLEAAHKGLVLIDMTTAEPGSTLKLAAMLAAKGAAMIDGPVTLTPREAEEGRLNILIGAEPAQLEHVRPVLETFCQRIFHIGPLGSAHRLKLINNFLTLGTTALVVEACTAARKAGVDPRMMVDLISVSGGDSVVFRRMGGLLTGDSDPKASSFAIKNAQKDVAYFWRLAESEGIYAPLADGVRRWYDLAVALGRGEGLLPELFEMHGELSDAPITIDRD